MFFINKKFLCSFCFLISLSSCKNITSKDIILSDLNLPETYSGNSIETFIKVKWWNSYPFHGLDEFIRTAIPKNLSILESKARLNQMKAIALKTSSSKFPTLNAQAGATQRNMEGNQMNSVETEEYYLGLAATYEIDLWRKVASKVKGALKDVEVSEKNLETVYMTITGKIIETWIKIVSEMLIQKKLQEQIILNESLFTHLLNRYENGLVSYVECLRQEQLLYGIRAKIPVSRQKEQLLRHELKLLAGKNTSEKLKIPDSPLEPFPPFPKTGIPLQLLNDRPDVLMNYLSLQAEMERLYVAKMNRLPSLKLDASYMFSSGHLSALFDNWFISLASGLLAPLIDGRSKKAEVKRMEALIDEKISSYKYSVLKALKDVEDAIVREKTQNENLKVIKKQVNVSKEAFTAALLRYQNGINDYISVSDFLFTLQSLEIQEIQNLRDLWLFRTSLHRTLGGNWIQELKQSENKE